MRLDKIYTKIGDKGTTMLASGEKVPKNCLRIEAYGTVDELNSAIAILRDSLDLNYKEFRDLSVSIKTIQNELFDIGGELATPASVLNIDKQQVVNEDCIHRLENEIDLINADIPPLENFIIPGGHLANSYAHLARCICRRAERNVISLSQSEEIRPVVIKYLNRLSDWLFVSSRFVSKVLRVEEQLWVQRNKV